MIATLLLVALAHGSDTVPADRHERLTDKREKALHTFHGPERKLPACDGLDQLSRSVFPPKPAVRCAEAAEYWDRLAALDVANREECRAADALLSEGLRDPSLCLGDGIERLQRRHDELYRIVEPAVDNLNASKAVDHLEDTLDEPPAGEQADPECRRVSAKLFEFRFRHAWIAENRALEADARIRKACGEERRQ